MMILGYLGLGTSLIASDTNVPLGALTVGYGISNAFGYFNAGDAPIAKFTRVNGISVIASILGLISIISGGATTGIWLLTLLHMFDTFQGAT